jgi:hypothetical protein
MTGFHIKIPSGRWQNEKRYAMQCVLEEFMELPIASIAVSQGAFWEVVQGGRKLTFPSLFFPDATPELFLTPAHLPVRPSRMVTYEALGIAPGVFPETSLPLFWGNVPTERIEDLDIFGTVFFFLSRYEEYVNTVRDEHGRFSALGSVAEKADIIHRPIVDEYVELLRHALESTFPGLKTGRPKYQMLLSHDVDVPHSWLGPKRFKLARAMARTLLVERSLSHTVRTVASYFNPRRDPVFCFDWIMASAEKHGLRTSFYFLANAVDPHDISYDLKSSPMQRLLRTIAERRHEIGLHGSYNSALDGEMLRLEKTRLEECVNLPVAGGRQHYLRFEAPTTWRAWNSAGFLYDSTLGFANQAGFRCGTAREFPVFDLAASEPLKLRERPLICMEHTLLDPAYQGLSFEQAHQYATSLIDRVRRYGGNFTLLWHNHNLVTAEQRALFLQLLAYGA